jgi:type IV pilus assembly protein PilC
MTRYRWVGRSRTGRIVQGTRAAVSPAALTQALRQERILVMSVAARRERRAGRSPRKGELAMFTRQLAVMVEAGLPIVHCLHLLSREAPDRPLSRVIDGVREDIEGGSSLTAALQKQPETFSRLYVSMVAAGEAGGVLDVILKRLAAFLESEARLAATVRSAMAYPVVVLAVAVVVVAVILWQVVPTFTVLFDGLDAALPLPTRAVIWASRRLPEGAPLLVGTGFAVVHTLRRWHARPSGRRWCDGLLLRVPVVGAIARKVAVARFCRTLSTLVGAGVPILTGLDITARSTGNAVIEDALAVVRARIEQGETIAEPLRASRVFPAMVAQMIAVGEATGTLDGMLARVAEFYEADVEARMAGALTLVEPVLICFLGVVVGGIVVSMYLPLVELVGQLS